MGVPVNPASTGVSSVPVPVPKQLWDRKQLGTSAPIWAAMSCSRLVSVATPHSCAASRKAAAASAEPPPIPEAIGNRFSSVKARPPDTPMDWAKRRAARRTKLSVSAASSSANDEEISL